VELPAAYDHVEDVIRFAEDSYSFAFNVSSSVDLLSEGLAEESISQAEDISSDESNDEPSLSSSSSSSSSQKDWLVEGDKKLTVSINAIRELDSEYFKRLSEEYPHIQEIQLIRRPSKRRISVAGKDIQSLGQHFPGVRVLRLNDLA